MLFRSAAAQELAQSRGWGPFYILDRIPLEFVLYRGRALPWIHSSAYGQAGEMMIELISQPDDAPSVLRERYAAHERGLHHVAYFVNDLRAAIEMQRTAGFEVVLEARTATGVDFVMVDTVRTFGHMLELYEPSRALTDFYKFIRRKAENWDGRCPVRELR